MIKISLLLSISVSVFFVTNQSFSQSNRVCKELHENKSKGLYFSTPRGELTQISEGVRLPYNQFGQFVFADDRLISARPYVVRTKTTSIGNRDLANDVLLRRKTKNKVACKSTSPRIRSETSVSVERSNYRIYHGEASVRSHRDIRDGFHFKYSTDLTGNNTECLRTDEVYDVPGKYQFVDAQQNIALLQSTTDASAQASENLKTKYSSLISDLKYTSTPEHQCLIFKAPIPTQRSRWKFWQGNYGAVASYRAQAVKWKPKSSVVTIKSIHDNSLNMWFSVNWAQRR